MSDGWAGLASVYLDGMLKVVDTYGGTTRYQQVIFRITATTGRIEENNPVMVFTGRWLRLA